MSRLRVLVCGAGNRAFPKSPATSNWSGWLELIRRSPRCELVAVHDIAPENLQRVARAGILPENRLFTSLQSALQEVASDVAVICPVAEAHAASVKQALTCGRHVLVEKPFVLTLADGLEIRDLAERRRLAVGVVQNWRTKPVPQALRRAIAAGRIGRVGTIFFQYVRDREGAHLPDYLFAEPFPLLFAMGIHHFDLFRYVLGENIVSVSGRTFRPPWTRYATSPGLHLAMESESGVFISYVGTISSRNRHLPLEHLVIDGERGSLSNASDWCDVPLLFSAPGAPAPEDLTAGVDRRDVKSQYDLADEALLDDFVDAVSTGRMPMCPPEDNLWTLATLFAAVRACETGETVSPRALLEVRQ